MDKLENRLLSDVDGIGDRCFHNLQDEGYTTIGDLLQADPDEAIAVSGFDMTKYSKVLRYVMNEYYK